MTLGNYILIKDLEKSARRMHKQRIRRGVQVQAQADATSHEIDQLQSEVEHLRLVVAGMLHLLQKNETLHSNDLDEVFAALDQMDGQADGKLSMSVHLDGTLRPVEDDAGPPSAMDSLVDVIGN
jgi:hypothetical protein